MENQQNKGCLDFRTIIEAQMNNDDLYSDGKITLMIAERLEKIKKLTGVEMWYENGTFFDNDTSHTPVVYDIRDILNEIRMLYRIIESM